MTNQTSGRLIAGITGIFLLTSVSLAFSGSVTVSWDANTETDLEGYNVYYGLESKNYSDVLDVGNVNSVSLSELSADQTYFFAVTAYDLTGNESPFSDEVSATITATDGGDANSDTTRPKVVAVVPRGETQIDLIFSEPVDKSSAENVANYSISNGVTIIGAVLDADPTIVHLITSAHTRGVDYILVVKNVADVNGNMVHAHDTKTYNIPDPAQDARPPELLYVAVKSETLLEVIFNESVRFAEAEDVGNYSISDGIPILQAKLRTNQSIVELTTSAHAPGTDYTLSVRDIKDLVGNLIGDKNDFSYRTKDEEANNSETDTVSPHLVAISVSGQTQVELSFNEPVKRTSAENPANYFINKNIEIKGAILSENQTTVHLVTSNHEFNVEYTLAISGVQDLAGNTIASDASATYTFAGDEEPSTNTGNQTPSSFSLFQNFPNPFNPETEIRFFLDEERKIEIKVYNQLGQVVKTLVKNSMSPGFHAIVWDGTNNEGNEVPSGVYIYSLEVTRNVLRGDLLVNVSLERRVKRMTLVR